MLDNFTSFIDCLSLWESNDFSKGKLLTTFHIFRLMCGFDGWKGIDGEKEISIIIVERKGRFNQKLLNLPCGYSVAEWFKPLEHSLR